MIISDILNCIRIIPIRDGGLEGYKLHKISKNNPTYGDINLISGTNILYNIKINQEGKTYSEFKEITYDNI